MVRCLRRGAGRVCEDDKGCGFRGLLGECIVKDEAIHATVAGRDVLSAHGHLVRLALANPSDRYEALVGQKILRSRLSLGQSAGLALGNAMSPRSSGRFVAGRRDETGSAASWVLYYAKVAGVESLSAWSKQVF